MCMWHFALLGFSDFYCRAISSPITTRCQTLLLNKSRKIKRGIFDKRYYNKGHVWSYVHKNTRFGINTPPKKLVFLVTTLTYSRPAHKLNNAARRNSDASVHTGIRMQTHMRMWIHSTGVSQWERSLNKTCTSLVNIYSYETGTYLFLCVCLCRCWHLELCIIITLTCV